MSRKGDIDIARWKALSILLKMERKGIHPDTLMEQVLDGFSPQDRAFIMELVYGVLRWRLRIDWIINLYSKIKTRKMEHLFLNILRIGVYQLLFLTKVPPHAAIDESVRLLDTSNKKKSGFINATLRRIDSERKRIIFPDKRKETIKHISVVYSHPEWLVKRWLDRYGIEETVALCKANNMIPTTTLRINTLKITKDNLIGSLASRGVKAAFSRYSPLGIDIIERPSSPLFPSQNFYIQDEGSQLIPYLLKPSPGEILLDACAGPGGKTTEMAQLMQNKGKIYAMDINQERTNMITELAGRLGIKIISAFRGDAEKNLEFSPCGGFDAILLDAPCSGLGVLRRNPDIKYKRSTEDLVRLGKLQSRIIDNLYRYIKKGGRLVYSTCSLEPEENEYVIKTFLNNHKDLLLENAADYLPENCRPLVCNDGFLRTVPHRDAMDGFFAARIKKS